MIKSKKDVLPKGRLVAIALAFILLAIALAVSPQQAPVVLFKLCLVTSAVVLGYVIDKIILPQVDFEDLARVIEEGSAEDRAHAVELAKASMIRRALIIFATTIGMCLGL